MTTDLTPIDPDSERGKRIAAGLSAVLDDVCERLHREGQPLPEALRPKKPAA